MSWTLIADGVVAVLLVATLIYVRRFSRQIAAIRDSRGEFEKLIADLTRSTDQAASHLHQFKAAAELAGKDLQARVDRTQGLAGEFGRMGEDLKLLTERAENAANRLEAVVARSRQNTMMGTMMGAATPAPSPTAPAQAAPVIAFPEDEDDSKVSSLSALSGLR